MSDVSSPTDAKIVNMVAEGTHRAADASNNRKEPITPMILKMKKHMSDKDEGMTLLEHRLFVFALIFNEIVTLKRSDVKFLESPVELSIVCGKTDIYREGQNVVVAKIGGILCPYNNFKCYLDNADIPEDRKSTFSEGCHSCQQKRNLNYML